MELVQASQTKDPKDSLCFMLHISLSEILVSSALEIHQNPVTYHLHLLVPECKQAVFSSLDSDSLLLVFFHLDGIYSL